MRLSDPFVAAAPSIGPAVVTLFGVQVPVLALSLSFASLLLARMIARPSVRRLSKIENICLTILLLIILFLIVTGQLFTSAPIGPGLAVVWAIGLGMSGVLVLELFGAYVMKVVKAFAGNLRGGGSDSGSGGTNE